MKAIIAPSILSAEFNDLKNQIRALELGKAELLHCDIMDGQFVPNLTFGPFILKSIKKITNIPLDVHLMVKEPMHLIKPFYEAGAEYLTIHYEAVIHHLKYISQIKDLGIKCGIAINPGTSLNLLTEIFPYIDLVLIMSVNPGFGGQSFIENSLNKIKTLKKIKLENGYNFKIEVDGGINKLNIQSCVNAGAEIIVAGSAIFTGDKITANLVELKDIVGKLN